MTAGPSERIVSGPLALTLLRFGAPLALGMGLQTTFNLVAVLRVLFLADEAVAQISLEFRELIAIDRDVGEFAFVRDCSLRFVRALQSSRQHER